MPVRGLLAHCRERGYLAKQLYVIFTQPVNGVEPVMENLADHLKFQEQLEADGIMVGAGPNWSDDEQAWKGDSMVVLRAHSRQDAIASLNGEIFYSMKEIRVLAERWRVHYNTVRPHSSLGYRPPAPAACVTKSLGYGEVETATRFPLLHTPDCDEITNKLAALH